MALDFTNATSAVVDYGSDASLDNLSAFTIIVTAYPTALTSGRRYFAKGLDNNGLAMWMDWTTSGAIATQVDRSTSPDQAVSTLTVSTNTWIQIAMTYDTTNGINIFTRSLNAPFSEVGYSTNNIGSGTRIDDSAQPFVVGNRVELDTSFPGRIDDIKVINARLSLAELNWHAFKPVFAENVVLFSKLGWQGTSTQVDYSGNQNDGTVTGATLTNHAPLVNPFSLSNFNVPYVVPIDTTINATRQELLLTELLAGINAATSLTTVTQDLVLSTQQAVINVEKSIAATLQSLSLVSNVAGIKADKSFTASRQALTLTTYVATVSQATGTNILATRQELLLDEKVAGVNAAINVAATRASLNLTVLKASITSGVLSTTYKVSTGMQTMVNPADTAVPLTVTVDDSGGVTGLTITAQIRDPENSASYLDFNDFTFKASGWVTKSLTLSDYGAGFYGTTLDISAITNFPSGLHAIVEYNISGSLLAVESSLLSMNQAWLDSRALTVGKFIGLH